MSQEDWYEYLFRVSQRNASCTFIMAQEMMHEDMNNMFSFRLEREKGKFKDALSPTGFVIMPNGHGGFQSTASIVTIAMQGMFYDELEAEAIESMKKRIGETSWNIEEYCKSYAHAHFIGLDLEHNG